MLAQHAGDDGAGVRTDARGPVGEALGAPVLDLLVRRRHVRVHRRVPALERAAHMAGDPAAAMEQFDDRHRQAHINLLAGKAVRHRVVVAGDIDMVVDADTGHLPLGKLIARRRQRPHGRPVKLVEYRLAATRQLLVRSRVQGAEQRAYAPIEFVKAEEALVAQLGQNPPLGQQHGSLRFRLVVSQQMLVMTTALNP